jgi:hypothetical protein
MADEQTPQSDLIDDAIRQAERQLEEKLEALRMSALGEASAPAEPTSSDDAEAAILRPTGGASRTSEGVAAPTHDEVMDPTIAWRETDSDDLSFAPAAGAARFSGDELYVPEQEAPLTDDAPSWDELPGDLHDDVEPAEQADPLHQTLTSTVTNLTPVWDDVDDRDALPPRPTTSRARQRAERTPEWDRPEPVHASWTRSDERSHEPTQPAHPAVAGPTGPVPPSDEEMQFWAQTRTALRNLQQSTEGLTSDVAGAVSGEVERIVHEELGATDATLRLMHQHLQQQLPRLQDQIEGAIDQSLQGPQNAISQLRDDLPTQLDRSATALRHALREDLDHTANLVHGAVQNDVAQLEQSIASNVTRMSQGTGEAVARVERDVDALGETVVRFERGVASEFDRVEQQLRAAIERVEQSVRTEIAEPAEAMRRLDQELPEQLTGIERTVVQQLASTQRELSTAMSSLVDANRATLDRVTSLTSTLDDDRARRSEDVEVIVDTVTTGWEGLAGAVKALFEQNDELSRRIAGIEQRLTQIRDLEDAVGGTLGELRSHVKDLAPAPIVVTVSHPEAEVRNETRTGWSPAGS